MVVGKNYLVRTDTDHWLGTLVSIEGPYSIVIDHFSWIADCGRLGEFLKNGAPKTLDEAKERGVEIEVAPTDLTNEINGKFVAIQWNHPLPDKSL